MTIEVYTCDQCKKPILDGEPVNGLFWNEATRTGRHWGCTGTFQNAEAR